MLKGLDTAMARALLTLTACLLFAGCGGRLATRPATDAVTRAERIDGPGRPRPEGRREAAGAPAEARPADLAPDAVEEEDLDRGAPPREATEKQEEADLPLRHILQRGQTLFSVARLYGVDLPELMKVNGIVDPTRIPAGKSILIPGGESPRALPPEPFEPRKHGADAHVPHGAPEARPGRGTRLAWPLHGAVTAAYGRRGKKAHHEGVDIDGQTGDPIQAAASGLVTSAGMEPKYGRVVVIDHGDGLTTLYAHASRLLVKPGDQVRAGEPIAEVGRSGNARGSHLHFEVRRDGQSTDPMPYLRSKAVLTAATH